VADELRAAGVAQECVAALDTPAGLDLGARTPGEIALSILARIVGVRRAGADHGIECRVVGHMDQQVDTRREEGAGAVATAVDPVAEGLEALVGVARQARAARARRATVRRHRE
jgi:hypothetical protein